MLQALALLLHVARLARALLARRPALTQNSVKGRPYSKAEKLAKSSASRKPNLSYSLNFIAQHMLCWQRQVSGGRIDIDRHEPSVYELARYIRRDLDKFRSFSSLISETLTATASHFLAWVWYVVVFCLCSARHIGAPDELMLNVSGF